MSEFKIKSNNLPPLQRLIILHLAKTNPQTIHETMKKLNKSYKPTWSAFKSLEKKKLIYQIGDKEHRGNKYPTFWLTDEGIMDALIEEAKWDHLLKTCKNLFPDEELLHCLVEISQYLNPEILRLARNVVKNKQKLNSEVIAYILMSNASFETDMNNIASILKILKKYPEEQKRAEVHIQSMIEKLNQLINNS